MRTLYVIGDSFSTAFDFGGKFREDYIKFKGYVPKYWGQMVAEELDLNLVTYGSVGDNEQILDKLIDILDSIKENDILCIGWTSILRFRWAFQDKWLCMFPTTSTDFHSSFITKPAHEEMIVNRENVLYKESLLKRIKLIEMALPNNLIISWSWENNLSIKANIEGVVYETISDDTDGLINDHHWSENGNKEFADWLIDKINKNKNTTSI